MTRLFVLSAAYVFGLLTTCAIAYLFGAFTAQSFDPQQWDITLRGVVATAAVVAGQIPGTFFVALVWDEFFS